MEYIWNENDERLSWLVLVHVLLLADMFENFKNSRLKSYGLCLSDYLDVPDLSWDALITMLKLETEIISYAYIYLFSEKYWYC